MLLDLLQTVGTERCLPTIPDSQSLAPSAASFLEGQPSPRSSFNSLGKAFPDPPSLSFFFWLHSILVLWAAFALRTVSLLSLSAVCPHPAVAGFRFLFSLLFLFAYCKVYCSKLLFYRPEVMQFYLEEREGCFPHPPRRGIGLVCLHAFYPLGHVGIGGTCLEDIPLSRRASGYQSVACSYPRS